MNHDVTSQSSNSKPKFFYGYIIVLISFLALFINNGSRSAFGVFLKPMLADLGSTRALISGVFSLSLVVTACLNIPIGRLVDKIGPRVTITTCGLLMCLGYLLMSQTTAIWQMYIFYGVLVGAGSTIYTPVTSTVVRWFSTRRNVMIGIVGAGASIGAMVFPVFASWLISIYDWRTSLVILGVIIIIILVVSAQFLKKEPAQSEQQADGGNKRDVKSSQSPSTDNSLNEALSNVQFWLFVTLRFIFGFGASTIMVHIVPYATDHGISATTAASILSVVGAAGIAGRVLMGSIGDKYGENRAVLVGFICRLIALILLMTGKELWMLYLFAIAFGFSSSVGVQTTPWIAKIFGLKSLGAISAATGIGHHVGFALGPLLAGFVFDSTHSYQLAFLTVAIVTFSGIIVTSILPVVGPKNKPA